MAAGRRVVAVLLATALALSAGACVSRQSVLTQATMDHLHLVEATDVTDAAPGDLPTFPITRDRAVALALAEAGVAPGAAAPGLRVLWGRGDARGVERRMWVVVIPGGGTIANGPVGAPEATITYTATVWVFDAGDGEFLVGTEQ
jgi:hypothetical protein